MDFITEVKKRGNRAVEYLIKRSEEVILPEDPLREASLHYIHAGGKGLRPAMLQIVCGALGGDENKAIPLAAAVEAVHVSSLIHDDLMDNDDTRRNVPAVWKKWDNDIAILSGDVLISLAYIMAGEVDTSFELKYNLSAKLANIYAQLCHGQMLDISFEKMDFESMNIDMVKDMQYLKTGVLFVFACISGAQIALNKLEDPLIDIIKEYARYVGTAFQIQDDIIGLIGDPKKVGKPIGSDIREGKRTQIAIHAITHANDEQKEILMKILGNHNASDEEINQALELIKQIGSIEYAKNLAIELASKAKDLIKELPQNDNSELLMEFADFMISREL